MSCGQEQEGTAGVHELAVEIAGKFQEVLDLIDLPGTGIGGVEVGAKIGSEEFGVVITDDKGVEPGGREGGSLVLGAKGKRKVVGVGGEDGIGGGFNVGGGERGKGLEVDGLGIGAGEGGKGVEVEGEFF